MQPFIAIEHLTLTPDCFKSSLSKIIMDAFSTNSHVLSLVLVDGINEGLEAEPS